jgi:hypothetical protein
MNLITIDPSLTCTAVIVNDKIFVYASESVAMTKTGKPTKWFDSVDHLITLRLHSNAYTATNHSDKEIQKLVNYNGIVKTIFTDVLSCLIPGEPIRVYIEGYSHSSEAGPLIDLVTFGTALRMMLAFMSVDDIQVHIVTPTELKMYTARFTYLALTTKKSEVIRNHQGVSGGKFTKHEMYKALIENVNLQCEWVTNLRNIAPDATAMKGIPKPIEDINDAKLMYEIAKSNKYF